GTVHPPEHLVVPGLDRQVNVLADLRQLRDRPNQRQGHVPGVARREPDPLDAFHLVHGPGQARQVAARRQIVPVTVGILAEEGDLPIPLRGEPGHLGDDGLRLHAPLAAPDVRHDAERTELVAPVDDVDEPPDRAAPQGGQAREWTVALRAIPDLVDRLAALPRLPEEFGEPVDVVDAEDQIEVGSPLADALAVLLHQTARDPQDEARPEPFERSKLAQPSIGLVIRAFADGAGVDQDHIRLGGVGRWPISHACQQPGHRLRVPDVHLAALGDDVKPWCLLHHLCPNLCLPVAPLWYGVPARVLLPSTGFLPRAVGPAGVSPPPNRRFPGYRESTGKGGTDHADGPDRDLLEPGLHPTRGRASIRSVARAMPHLRLFHAGAVLEVRAGPGRPVCFLLHVLRSPAQADLT